MSLNIHPGVVCGYCIDPADAFLFAQINNGNALSLPFAKGFGWGAELNVRFIFEKKPLPAATAKAIRRAQRTAGAQCRDPQPGQSSSSKENYLDTLRAIDPQLVKTAISGPRFQECFFRKLPG